jgi:indole-3-glycerol phosphate synthase
VILDEILAHKRLEVAERKAKLPLDDLADVAESQARGRFAAALRQPGVSAIAEFKRRSPSGGVLRPDASAAEVARRYAAHGAAALSILTDEKYFGGYDKDLQEARAASHLPALRKDFVVDPYQLHEAHALGADAILLIVRTLTDAELRDYLALARSLDLDALVETHSEEEVERALAAGAAIVGVNNRDLDTLVTDVSLCLNLRSKVPSECVFVAESGISQPEHMRALADAGVDAVLIGEALVRAPDPGARLAELLAAGSPSSAGTPA